VPHGLASAPQHALSRRPTPSLPSPGTSPHCRIKRPSTMATAMRLASTSTCTSSRSPGATARAAARRTAVVVRAGRLRAGRLPLSAHARAGAAAPVLSRRRAREQRSLDVAQSTPARAPCSSAPPPPTPPVTPPRVEPSSRMASQPARFGRRIVHARWAARAFEWLAARRRRRAPRGGGGGQRARFARGHAQNSSLLSPPAYPLAFTPIQPRPTPRRSRRTSRSCASSASSTRSGESGEGGRA